MDYHDFDFNTMHMYPAGSSGNEIFCCYAFSDLYVCSFICQKICPEMEAKKTSVYGILSGWIIGIYWMERISIVQLTGRNGDFGLNLYGEE